MNTRTKILIIITAAFAVLALTELVAALIVFISAAINHGGWALGLYALLVPVITVVFIVVILKTDISKFIDK